MSVNFWVKMLNDVFRVLATVITRYREEDDAAQGHECGHQWHFTVTCTGHYSVKGDPDHRDAPAGSGDDLPATLTVRAHNLRDALLLASTKGLSDWDYPDHYKENQ